MKNFILFFILIGCDQVASKSDLEFVKREPVTAETKVSFEELQQNLFATNRCLNCHGFLNSEEEVKKRIVAGKPELSPLYIVIENGSMPMGGPEVSQNDLDYLKQYIEQMEVVDGEEDEIKVTIQDIKEKVVDKYGCASCHSRYNDLENSLSSEVVAGSPQDSRFFKVMESGFMPRVGPRVTEEDLAIVEQYIQNL